jgi:ribose 5-phosphate isomerase B
MTPTTIYLGTDHAGFAYKELIKKHLEEGGYVVVDHGAYVEDANDDYPIYIHAAAMDVSKLAEKVSDDMSVFAIILGGSGQGEAIAAGRLPYVRTTVCYGGPDALQIIQRGREHNNANVLSLGARFIKESDVLAYVDTFLTTPFSKEERHVRRLIELETMMTK